MSAHGLSWALRAVNRRSGGVDTALARRLGMTTIEYSAMTHIMEADQPIGPIELGHRLGISPGSASELVDRLAAAGHVERRRDQEDRRRVALHATPASIDRVLGELRPLFDAIDELGDGLGPRDQVVVERYLRDAAALLADFAESPPATDT